MGVKPIQEQISNCGVFKTRLLRVTSQFPFLNPTYVQGMEKIPITFLLDSNGMFNMRIMIHFRLYFNLQYS